MLHLIVKLTSIQRMTMKITIHLSTALLILTAASSLSAQTTTHCAENEKIVFSCSVGKKVVSLCASQEYGAAQGWMQYRFGVPGQIEMTYPSQKVHPTGKFTAFYATPTMDDGTQAMIAEVGFRVNDFGYNIATVAKQKSAKTDLTVTKGGKTLATLICVPNTIINSDLSSMDVLSTFGLQ